MKKILSVLMIAALCFVLCSCGGYKTATDVVNAYYKAYEAGNAEQVLECYPKEARDYFIASEGGKEAFSAAVKNIAELGKTTVTVKSERKVEDTKGIDSSLEHIGNLFEYEDAVYVDLTIYITFPDGTTEPADTSNLETTTIACVKVDGSWYVFTDILYEGEDE